MQPLSTDWDQRGDVGMNCREAAIERRELSFSTACEMAQIGIGDLSMAHESGDDVAREWQIIGPEFVAGQALYPTDGGTDIARGVADAQEVSNECPLSDRTCCEALVAPAEPVASRLVVHVISVDERDQDVRVK
jgi:hypothetical protein